MKQRTWSLRHLHDALKHALAPNPAPSLPTLKAWSRAGKLASSLSADIDTATAQIVQRIQAGELCVRGPRPQGKATRATRMSASVAEHEELLDLLREVADGLRKATAPRNSATQNPAPAAALPVEIERAITQLEATRKHVLVQLDAQRQLMQASLMPQGNNTAHGIDFLEWQRLVTRVARIEDTLNRLAARLGVPDGA